jgi:L-lactate utilization protein LutC
VATWADILERVEQALQRTMAEVAGRGQEPEPPPAGGVEQEATWRQRLEQCDARLRQLQACVQQAESHAAEADSALATSAETLQGWLATAAAARQKLENREGHPV